MARSPLLLSLLLQDHIPALPSRAKALAASVFSTGPRATSLSFEPTQPQRACTHSAKHGLPLFCTLGSSRFRQYVRCRSCMRKLGSNLWLTAMAQLFPRLCMPYTGLFTRRATTTMRTKRFSPRLSSSSKRDKPSLRHQRTRGSCTNDKRMRRSFGSCTRSNPALWRSEAMSFAGPSKSSALATAT